MNMAPSARPALVETIARSLIVGLAYSLITVLVAAVLGPLSRQAPTVDNALVWWLSGVLLSLTFAPFVIRSIWSRSNTVLAVWAAILLIRTLGLGIEGSLFKPAQANIVLAGAAAGFVVGFLTAWLTVALLMPLQREGVPDSPRFRCWFWTWRVLLVGLAYFVFYFVFGATNALLYTKSFYENNPKYGLALPPAASIFLAQLIRGPLFGLGSLFIARSSDMPRRQMRIWLGLLLFVVGGLGPYLEVIFRTMPLGFNLATLAEIFLQNFLTGAVAANLYRIRPQAASS